MGEPLSDNELEAGYGALRAKLKGASAIYILVLLCFASLCAYLLWRVAIGGLDHQTNLIQEEHAQQLQLGREQHDEIKRGIGELRDAMDRQTYVSTLSPKEKEELNKRLSVPSSLERLMKKRPYDDN